MTFNSGADLIIKSLEKQYSQHIATITDISRDTSKGKEFIEMGFKSLHFDKVPYLWSADKEGAIAFSVDTLLFDSTKDILYLVEFKSRWPKEKEGQELRLKCYESLGKLLKYWVTILQNDRLSFFDIKIKYCVITRARARQNPKNESFVDALEVSQNFFKLKYLDGAFLDETRIIVDDEKIFRFLTRVTGFKSMIYHKADGSVVHYGSTEN